MLMKHQDTKQDLFSLICLHCQSFRATELLHPVSYVLTSAILACSNVFLSPLSDLLLCRQHLWHCRSQAEWYPVRHSGNRCSECLHDHSCCKYPVRFKFEKLLTAKEGRSWYLQSVLWSYQQETAVMNSKFVLPGLHRGGLGTKTAPPLWLWDLLWSLCAAHCRSQLPGTMRKLQCDSHPQYVTLLPSSGCANKKNQLCVRFS